jgi:DnaJ-class molecular chaperone
VVSSAENRPVESSLSGEDDFGQWDLCLSCGGAVEFSLIDTEQNVTKVPCKTCKGERVVQRSKLRTEYIN